MFVFVEYVTNMKRRATFFLSLFPPSLPLFSLIVLSRAFKGECRKITPSYLLMVIEGKQKERAGVALQLSPGPTTTWTQTCEWTAARRRPVCPIALCVFPSAGPHVYLLFLCTHKHIQAWFVLPSKKKKLIWTSSWPEGRERVCVCVHLMNRGKHSKNVPSSYMPNALLPRVLVDSS